MAITKFSTVQVKSGETETVDLGSTIINASTSVQGFDVSYNHDHHVRSISVASSMKGISGWYSHCIDYCRL